MFGNSFEGSDLASVYGSPMMDGAVGQIPPPPAMQSMGDVHRPPQQQAGPAVSAASMSHAAPPDVPYSPPPAMYSHGPTVPMGMYMPSYWDRLASKRAEVFKLAVLSLVILLALSVHTMAKHYIKAYVASAFLTPMQEVLVRMSYPVMVVLVLWIMKTLA